MVAWDGTVVLTTPRLLLRTFRREDLPAYAALNAHPEVVRYLGGEPLSRQHSDEIAEWAQECYETEGIGLLAVERRTDGAFLGMLTDIDPPNERSIAVMRRLGLTRDHEADIEDDGLTFRVVVYSITAGG
jgi:RimJ/RimL family protein N-acetyltransferase